MIAAVVALSFELEFRDFRPVEGFGGNIPLPKGKLTFFDGADPGEDAFGFGPKFIVVNDGVSADKFSTHFMAKLLALAAEDHAVKEGEAFKGAEMNDLGVWYKDSIENFVKRYINAQTEALLYMLENLKLLESPDEISKVEIKEKNPTESEKKLKDVRSIQTSQTITRKNFENDIWRLKTLKEIWKRIDKKLRKIQVLI